LLFFFGGGDFTSAVFNGLQLDNSSPRSKVTVEH